MDCAVQAIQRVRGGAYVGKETGDATIHAETPLSYDPDGPMLMRSAKFILESYTPKCITLDVTLLSSL